MSDHSALAARQETGDREVETGVKEQQEVAENAVENAEGLEQKATEGTKGDEQAQQPEVHEQDAATGRLTPPARQDLAERIRQSEALPAGLRARLAELVLAEDGATADAAVRAVEASLPGALVIGGGEIARPAHPAGDVFFHGDAEAVSEEAAEALARGQLARSGMLRGQRARVAE